MCVIHIKFTQRGKGKQTKQKDSSIKVSKNSRGQEVSDCSRSWEEYR